MVHSLKRRKLCTVLALFFCVQALFSPLGSVGITEVQAATKVVFAKSVRKTVRKAARRKRATSTIVIPKVINYIDVYKKPDTSSKVAGRMYRGTGAYLIRTKGKFSYISSGSLTGWIENRILVSGTEAKKLVKTMKPAVATITASELNVRKSGDGSSKVIVSLPKGTRLTVLSDNGTWLKVRLAKYDVGYVSKKYVRKESGLCPGVTIAQERKMERWIEKGSWDDEDETTTTAEETQPTEEETKATEEETDPTEEETAESTEDADSHHWKSLGTFKLTAYCPCAKCNGPGNAGKTATGVKPQSNHTIAVDRKVIPLWSKIRIGDSDIVYVAEDTGVKGNHIDIFHDTHSEAMDFGVKYREIFICTD